MHFDFGLRSVLLAAMVLALPGLAFAVFVRMTLREPPREFTCGQRVATYLKEGRIWADRHRYSRFVR